WRSRGRTILLTTVKMSAPEIRLARVSADKTPSTTAADDPAPPQLAGIGGIELLPLAVSAPASAASGASDQAHGTQDTSDTASRSCRWARGPPAACGRCRAR